MDIRPGSATTFMILKDILYLKHEDLHKRPWDVAVKVICLLILCQSYDESSTCLKDGP